MKARAFPILHWLIVALVLTLAGLLAGCATQGLRPGTGDLSFRLHWEGETDLDLHVVDPLERHTGIGTMSSGGTPEEQLAAMREMIARQLEDQDRTEDSEPAGILDIDCNSSPHRLCPRPIENVYWPEGTALTGRYTFWVHLFNPILEGAPEQEVAFTVEVRRGDRIIETLRGILDNGSRTSPTFEHQY